MAYIGNQPGYGKPEVFVVTASGGETSVSTADDGRSINYAVGYVSVYLNGVLLVDGTDYTATSGSSISGLSALTAGDVVTVVSFETFAIPDAVSEQSGGAFLGDVTVPNLLVSDGGNIGSASDPDAMSIAAGGAVTFSQNIVMAAGKGIDFSANANAAGMASELLDDYEEGTWTPTYGTTGTNFSSVTYLSDQTYGRYIKVGSLVYLYGALRTSAVTKGSASGILTVEGIPFAAADFGGTSRYIMGSASAEDFITEWPTSVAINTGSTPNALWLFTNRDNGDATLLDVNNVSTGSGDNWIYGFAISYHTNA